jgi:acetyltransferase-like isoleucine patch superfamily enzyme
MHRENELMFLRGMIYVGRRLRWRVGGIWGRMVLRSYGVKFGHGLTLGSAPVVRLKPQARITLGNNVRILNELAENPVGIPHRTVLAADLPGAELIVGDDVGMSGAILYAWKRIEIRERVCLGIGAAVYDTDFHPLDPQHRWKNDLSQVAMAPVLIEHDAWVGAGAKVLKGVTVGHSAVVGAGAIVTANVPPGAIVAGIPPRGVGWGPGFGEK